jgi:hypothetical protein
MKIDRESWIKAAKRIKYIHGHLEPEQITLTVLIKVIRQETKCSLPDALNVEVLVRELLFK